MRHGAIAFVLLAAASPAAAQLDFQPSQLGTILPSLTRQDPLSVALKQKRSATDLAAPVRTDHAANLRSLRFTPSIERRKANYARFLERSRTAEPPAPVTSPRFSGPTRSLQWERRSPPTGSAPTMPRTLMPPG